MGAVDKAISEKLKRIRNRMRKIQDTINHFSDPFPREEDFDYRGEFLKAYNAYIKARLTGQFAPGKLVKLNDELIELQRKETELAIFQYGLAKARERERK